MNQNSGWYVVLGSLISFLGTAFGTWLTQRATEKREAKAQDYREQEKRKASRHIALMELQEIIGTLNSMAVNEHMHLVVYQSSSFTDEDMRNRTKIIYDTQKLEVRIGDKLLVKLVEEF